MKRVGYVDDQELHKIDVYFYEQARNGTKEILQRRVMQSSGLSAVHMGRFSAYIPQAHKASWRPLEQARSIEDVAVVIANGVEISYNTPDPDGPVLVIDFATKLAFYEYSWN